jgi:hypothetical protein
MPVTLTKHGVNNFRVVAIRKGYVKSSTMATIMRELSAAERAVIRQERAAARAGSRALASAESYLEFSGFSKQGLYEQLSSDYGEGFTEAEAQYAVDHVDVDWNKEAVESARSYLESSPMSRDGLIEQLSSSYGEGVHIRAGGLRGEQGLLTHVSLKSAANVRAQDQGAVRRE